MFVSKPPRPVAERNQTARHALVQGGKNLHHLAQRPAFKIPQRIPATVQYVDTPVSPNARFINGSLSTWKKAVG